MVQIYNKNADILTDIGIKFSIKNSFRFYISNCTLVLHLFSYEIIYDLILWPSLKSLQIYSFYRINPTIIGLFFCAKHIFNKNPI